MAERNDYFETQLAYCADEAFLLAKQQALFIVESISYHKTKPRIITYTTNSIDFQIHTFK